MDSRDWTNKDISKGYRLTVTKDVPQVPAFGYLAIRAMGYSGREVGQFLNMRSYSAIRISEKGKEILDKRKFLSDLLAK